MEDKNKNWPAFFWTIILLLAVGTLAGYAMAGYLAGYVRGTIHGMAIERAWNNGVNEIKIQAVGPERVKLFTEATSEMAYHLMGCESQMAGYPEWPLALAIAGAETDYCREGVGRQNNCGGITSRRPDRAFKEYETRCDGLEDIAMTLRKPIYGGLGAGQDLARLGRIWCGRGEECLMWPSAVRARLETATANEIRIKNEPLW